MQAQGRLLPYTGADAVAAAGVAGESQLRHDPQVQLSAGDGSGLRQQQAARHADGVAAGEALVIRLGQKRHRQRQAPQAGALLRGIEHRDQHRAADLPARIFPQAQLSYGVHDAGDLRAVLRDRRLQRLLLRQGNALPCLAAGQLRILQFQLHVFVLP